MTEQEKKPVDMGPRMVGSLSVDESRLVRERQASRSNVMGCRPDRSLCAILCNHHC